MNDKQKQRSLKHAFAAFFIVILKIITILVGWILRLIGLLLLGISDLIQKKVTIK